MQTSVSRHPERSLAASSRDVVEGPLYSVVAAQFSPSTSFRTIRIWLAVFILGLVLSGITAFPLQSEAALLVRASHFLGAPQHFPALHAWLLRVASALADTDSHYPFLAYGTDWLAFGHLVIAVAFIGPWLDPVRNKWIITFGLIACAGVVPLALIAGHIRGIPFFWRCIDSSFGILGAVPLLICRQRIQQLELCQTP